MQLFGAGLTFIAIGFWEIYRGRSSFFLLGEWWMWPTFDRDESPRMFWFCIALDFLAALACFGTVMTHWGNKGTGE